MSSMATQLIEKHSTAAMARASGEDIKAWTRKSRGDLEGAAGIGIAMLELDGCEINRAGSRMVNPDIGLLVETSYERVVQAIYRSMDYDTAVKFNKNLETFDAVPSESVGHLAMWAFEDGSAWVSFSCHEREVAYDATRGSEFEEKDSLCEALWRMWGSEDAPLSVQVGKKFLAAKEAGFPMVGLSAPEARAFIKGLSNSWGEAGSWGKGMTVRMHASGVAVPPAEFVKIMGKALSKGKEDLAKAGAKRMEEIKKERDNRMKIHWRDAMCIFMVQTQAAPVYDAGMAAFLMSKPGLFGMFPLPVWRKIFMEVVDQVKALPEGESPEINSLEASASILGGDVAAQMAHFLYRYHRSGGAKLTAKRVLEQTRDRMATEAAKQGLAAAVKNKDKEVMSDEMRESTKLASSVEFSTQYGSSLALYAALWAKEVGFVDISLQARAVVRTMRGAGEVTMECFGWFARLLYEFSEGFVAKEDIAAALRAEMDAAASAADAEKRAGGKITIENEWSGNWGTELSGRKVREYLGLEKTR